MGNRQIFKSTTALLGSAILEKAHAELCFANESFPKTFADAALQQTSQVFSITSSETLNKVFSGGYTDMQGGAAWVMAINLDANSVQWRRYFKESGNEMNTITAMSVNPSDSAIAVVGSTGRQSNVFWFFTIRPNDGGHITSATRKQLGSATDGIHQVSDSGLYFAANGQVYVALK